MNRFLAKNCSFYLVDAVERAYNARESGFMIFFWARSIARALKDLATKKAKHRVNTSEQYALKIGSSGSKQNNEFRRRQSVVESDQSAATQ